MIGLVKSLMPADRNTSLLDSFMTESLSYRNQFIDLLLCKSVGWFLYDRDLRHERVKALTH